MQPRIGPLVAVALLLACGTARGQAPPPPPPQLPPIPVPAENPITPAKRVLGKILFWDEQLSSDGTVACGTCHLPELAGSDDRLGDHPGADEVFGTPDDVTASPGVAAADAAGGPVDHALFGFDPQVTPRATQAIVGTQWSGLQFWDGRAIGIFEDPQTGETVIPFRGALETQALGPILSEVEMGRPARTWEDVATKLQRVRPMARALDLPPDMANALPAGTTYPDLFAAAFGDPAITARRIAFAMATYERTLLPNQTPYDAFARNVPGALTPLQELGWNVFRATPCAGCHAPPFFTDNTFHNVGVRPWQDDAGRMGVTGVFADRGAFKTPTLRNTELKATFMHSGQLRSLDEALDFYGELNGHVQFPDGRAPALPIVIPDTDRPALLAFIREALLDPRVAAGSFPFDRPTLRSELPAEPDLRLSRDPLRRSELRVIPPPGPPATGYRVFRGTIPTSGGSLRTLGTRGTSLEDAYDHSETDCGLVGTASDVTSLLSQPGSFYVLVAAVSDSGCAGLGSGCLVTGGVPDCIVARPHPVVACERCAP